jgi:hypothetical protein
MLPMILAVAFLGQYEGHRPRHPAPPVPPPVAMWRLADATGQRWDHPDKAYLAAWVADRDRAMIAPAYPRPTAYFRPRGCANGQCR